MPTSIYDLDLDKNPANYQPLTPLGFLERAAAVYPDRTAIIHGPLRRTYRDFHARACRLANALVQRGIKRGDTIAVLLANTPAMLECHYGVPMTGAVLNTLNTRLDAAVLAFSLDHGEAKILIVDREFSSTAKAALALATVKPLVIDYDDPEFGGTGERIGTLDYEAFLAKGDPQFERAAPLDEWDAISLNYTSGTTGNPKGVVYHHRGAYLLAQGNVVTCGMGKHPVYLWTLPMFHCNGWCFPWTLAARAGVNICLRKFDPQQVLELIAKEKVTHYCGAPIVQSALANAPAQWRDGIKHKVSTMVAASPPSSAMLAQMVEMGFDITHVYGLTEVYGPATVCAKQEDWSELSLAEQAQKNARQGVRYHLQQAVTVMDPETMQPVPADGETLGEIMFRGNICMKGYLKNPVATEASFKGGWFHTGDLAVMNPDGYVRIKDRSKDIIISGGENISSIEIEDALYQHPAVIAAAVVAAPDIKWGEVPCAFIETRAGVTLTKEDVIAHCKKLLASFKVPKIIVFKELPKTSTGKIQKFILREEAGSITAIDQT